MHCCLLCCSMKRIDFTQIPCLNTAFCQKDIIFEQRHLLNIQITPRHDSSRLAKSIVTEMQTLLKNTYWEYKIDTDSFYSFTAYQRYMLERKRQTDSDIGEIDIEYNWHMEKSTMRDQQSWGWLIALCTSRTCKLREGRTKFFTWVRSGILLLKVLVHWTTFSWNVLQRL